MSAAVTGGDGKLRRSESPNGMYYFCCVKLVGTHVCSTNTVVQILFGRLMG